MSSLTIGKEGFDTPTTISEEVLESLSVTYSSLSATVGIEASPWKGGTFIIRDPKRKLVVALKEGVLGLFDGIYQYGRGSHWHSTSTFTLTNVVYVLTSSVY